MACLKFSFASANVIALVMMLALAPAAQLTTSNKDIQILPSSSALLNIGGTDTIHWTARGVTTLKLEYCFNYNSNIDSVNIWHLVSSSISALSRSTSWTVTAPPSSGAPVTFRLSDAMDSTTYDLSDFPMPVYSIANRLRLESPIGGEAWTSGDTLHNVTWAAQGTFNMAIEYSNDSLNWAPIASNPIGSTALGMTWKTSASLTCSPCFLRIRDLDNPAIKANSRRFQIQAAGSLNTKDVQITQPNAIRYASVGDSLAITWASRGVTTLKLEYCYNYNSNIDSTNIWRTASSLIPASLGSTKWAVTAPVNAFTPVTFRLSDATNQTIYDISDAQVYVYSVGVSPSLQISSPAGGEKWTSGDTLHDITWTYQGFFNVVIESSHDSANWTAIATDPLYSFSTHYRWKTVADSSCSPCFLRIKSQDNASIVSYSKRFSIGPSSPANQKDVQIIQPSPTTMNWFPAAQAMTVRWSSRGVSTLKLEYSYNYSTTFGTSTTWSVISNALPASLGATDWVIQAPPYSSAAITFRLSDATDSTIYDISEQLDYVLASTNIPRIRLMSPIGGETWTSGDTLHNITWAYKELTALVIEYSHNNTDWLPVTTYTIYSSSTNFVWRIPPDLVCSPCNLRIRGSENSALIDQTHAAFNILPSDQATLVKKPWIMSPSTRTRINAEKQGRVYQLNGRLVSDEKPHP